MKQCFRIALWMFFLIGFLQAKPVTSKKDGQENNPQGKPFRFNMDDLGLKFLRQDVSCEHHVNFTYPTSVQDRCHTAALECFIDGLEHARKYCTGELWRIDQALDVLEMDSKKQPMQANSSECKWEGNKESHKKFADFVNAFENFAQLNSIPGTTNPH